MKKFMMKHLMVNCREATMLMAKREEGRLSLTERFKLSIHISMCSFCRMFEKQTSFIRKESRHIHHDANLSASAKDNMEGIIREHFI